MFVVNGDKRPVVGDVYALDVRDIMQFSITPTVDGEDINKRISLDTLEENGELYKKQYAEEMTYEETTSLRKLKMNDPIGCYCLFTEEIEGNDTKLITFVKYLGKGLFLDLTIDKIIRANIPESSEEVGRESAEYLYYDYVFGAVNTPTINVNKEYYTSTPLVIDLGKGVAGDNSKRVELHHVDSYIIRKFAKQDMAVLRNYMEDLYNKASDNISKQIELLPLQDEYLAYAENEFRNTLSR